jgi:hypothetical protein
VRSAGQQFDESRAGTVMSFAAQAGLELRLPLGATRAAFIAAELGLPLRRERFYFVDPDGVTRHDVYRMAPSPRASSPASPGRRGEPNDRHRVLPRST